MEFLEKAQIVDERKNDDNAEILERMNRLESNMNRLLGDMMERTDKLENDLTNQYTSIAKKEIIGHSREDMKNLRKRMQRLEMRMDQLVNDREHRMNDESPELVAVRRWMNTVVKLPQYLDLFIDNGFEDLSVIQALTVNDLQVMGIEKRGHQIKILQCIAKLKAATTGNAAKTHEGSAWI